VLLFPSAVVARTGACHVESIYYAISAVVIIHASFGASEASYVKDQEIYGQGECAELIYEVTQGVVRSYKVLSDGRRQISAFHLPHDIFGWEVGPSYRFTAEAVIDTTVRVVRRQTLEYVAATDIGVTRNLLSMVRIPTKSPGCTDMKSPGDSETMSPTFPI